MTVQEKAQGRYKTVVIDDQRKSRYIMVDCLKEFDEIDVQGVCTGGMEGLRFIQSYHPHLIFLDVEMPEMDGFQVLDKIDITPYPAIVLVSRNDQNALRAFEAGATDFIHKPVKLSRIAATVKKLKRLELRNIVLSGDDILPTRNGETYRDRFILKEADTYVLLRTEEICYIEADGNYVRLHTTDRRHLVRNSLSRLNRMLNPDRFFRISRSHMVNIEEVETIEKHTYGNYLVSLQGGISLKMSKNYKELLQSMTRL